MAGSIDSLLFEQAVSEKHDNPNMQRKNLSVIFIEMCNFDEGIVNRKRHQKTVDMLQGIE